MKHISRALLILLLLGCGWQQAWAQNRSISGRVTDRTTGQGLPGVTVLAKGTTAGASTNADGNYSLDVPAAATRLIFSFVGYVSQERELTGGNIDVALATDLRQLDEVVVNGLASTVKRSNLGNAVSTVSAQELYGSTRPVTLDAALNGKIVGANINATSGAPGGGIAVQLRGVSTLSGSPQPLFIIDGVYAVQQEIGNGAGSSSFTGASAGTGRTSQDQGTNRLSDINPADIESVEILKGPSAAAIYGQRANAGVILIRTKRGAAGQTKVNFTQDVGFQFIQRYIGYSDFDAAKANSVFQGGLDDIFKAANGRTFNYEKEVFGNKGFLRNTNISLSGGNDRTRFYVAAGATREDGIVKNTNYERYSIRANVDQKIGSRIDFSLNSGFNNSTNNRGFFGNDNNGVAIGYNLLSIPSFVDLHKDPTTGLFPPSPVTGDNPLAVIDKGVNRETTNRVTEAATATLRIIDQENSSLRLATQGGLDFAASNALLALPADLQSQQSSALPGVVRIAKNQFFNYNVQAFLIYDYKLGAFALNSQVGSIRLGQQQQLQYSQGQNLAPGPLQPDRGTVTTQQNFNSDEADVAFVGQQQINWQDRIIATGGVRFDKSTRNGDASKYYTFPRGSLAINLAKFDFFQIEGVNLVKLRAAYGETGGPAGFGALYSPLTNISTGGLVGLVPAGVIGNPNIRPESATEFETGIDLGFFGGRLGLEASYYNKSVRDLITVRPLSPGTGVSSIRAFNVGDLRNRGLELALTIVPVRASNLTWTSTTQFWFNRSLVTRLADNIPAFDQGSGFGGGYGTTFFALGESPTRWYGTPRIPLTSGGNPVFARLTGYGDAQPTFQMSYLNSFNIYRNFDLSFLLHWKKDSYTSNLTVTNQDGFGTSPDYSNPYTNPDGTPGGLLGDARQSFPASYYIQNSGYVRLREVSLYYTLAEGARTALFKDFIKTVKIGASANNLITWTTYKGYDPEVSNFGATGTQAQVDVVGYPSTRRVFFTLNLGF